MADKGPLGIGIPRRSLNPGAMPFRPPGEAAQPANHPATAPADQLTFRDPFGDLREHTPTPASFQSMNAGSVSTTADSSQELARGLESQFAPRGIQSGLSLHTLMAGTIHSATRALTLPSTTQLQLQSENFKPPAGLTQARTAETTNPAAGEESTSKKQGCVSEVWDRAEREMALYNPGGWADLAMNSYQQLLQLYGHGAVPKEVLEAHREKYASAYANGPLKGLVSTQNIAMSLPELQQALPANLQKLMNAGTQATMMSTLQGTPTAKRRFTTSTTTEDEFLTPVTDGHQLLQNVLDSDTKPFSPGPAFPVLGATQSGKHSHSTSSSSLSTTTTTLANQQVLTRDAPMEFFADQNGTIQIPYPGGPVPYTHMRTMPRARLPKTRQSSGSRHFLNQVADASVPLNAFIKGPMRGTGGHGRKQSRRRFRTDQGPLPSEADIYPDDELAEAPQEVVQTIDKSLPWGDISPEKTPGAAYLQALTKMKTQMQIQQHAFTEKQDSVSPTASVTPKAKPNIFAEYIPIGATQYLHLATGEVSSAQNACKAHETHEAHKATATNISALRSPFPLSLVPTQDFIERVTDSPNPDFLLSKSRLPKFDANIQRPPAAPMDEDQRNGTRYGLRFGGIGWGDNWAPPAPQQGTVFCDMGHLWGKH